MSAEALLEPWRAAWPEALALWSRVLRLSEPRWCLSADQEQAEGLSSSFAMIRLTDHAVVISLRQIDAMKLQKYALEVLAHEIGHHIYAPGDLSDQAMLLVRLRAALSDLAPQAPLIANLYTDLLINDRLQRTSKLQLSEVYLAMRTPESSTLWSFYMRIYEQLWGLPRGQLAPPPKALTKQFEHDAHLGARLIRVYARDWLSGASGFGALCYPYLRDDAAKSRTIFVPFLDAMGGGDGDTIPGGLTSIDPGELEGLHPAADPRVNGLPEGAIEAEGQASSGDKPPPPFRPPGDFRDLLRSLGVKLSDEEIICRYYRELAIPYLIPFPERRSRVAKEPMPESLDSWGIGDPLEDLDWFESTIRSPFIVPGYTTVRRLYGITEGASPEKDPVDLYLGVDCSGSMRNPAYNISYPVVAGAIIALSALRAGAKVKVVLSGEPGRHTSTPGFVRDEDTVLRTLTAYLGTGYTFGIPRLLETFDKEKAEHPAHILIVTDSDIYMMLNGKDGAVGTFTGWDVARTALTRAAGGGTMVLHGSGEHADAKRLRGDGWDVQMVAQQEDLVRFAGHFASKLYEIETALEEAP